MKILISAKVEGANMLDTADSVDNNAHEALTEEVNVLVDTAYTAGATKVLVVGDVLMDMLDERAMYLKQHEYAYIEGVSDNVQYLIQHGYTGRTNVAHSFMARTYDDLFTDIKIDGVSVSEATFNALVAKQFGVKSIFVSGTDHAVQDCPVPYKVVIKESLSWHKAQSRPRNIVLKELADTLTTALQSDIDFVEGEIYNVTVEVELAQLSMAEALPLPRTAPRTVIIEAPSIESAYLDLLNLVTE